MIIPTNAKPEYMAAIQSIYGTNLCAECHIDQNGGKSLTDFGIKFKAQPNYEADPAAAYNIVKGNESVTAVPTTVKGNEPEKKSPGFDILLTIGIISAIYILHKKR